MTIILSCRDHNGNVYLLGDSAITSGSEVRLLKRPKVIAKPLRKISQTHADGTVTLGDSGECLLVGLTGDSRILDVIEHELELIQPNAGVLPAEWVHTEFTAALSNALERISLWDADGGTKYLPHNTELLIAMRGDLINYTTALQVVEYQEDYDAIGNGREFALGALDALRSGLWGSALKTEQQLLEAARIAAKRVSGVEPPFRVIAADTAGMPLDD